MKKLIFFSFLFISFSTISQNNLWPDYPINTGANGTWLVIDVFHNNEELSNVKLGAFYTDDNGELQNGYWIVWNDTQNNFAVAADDSTTPYKDGFYEGEEITWLATYDNGITTYEASVEYTMGPGGMGSNYFTSSSVNVIALFTILNT